MTDSGGNGSLRYQVQEHERRLTHLEAQPIIEMRVELGYVKEELAKVDRTVVWILRTLVAFCITLLVGILLYVATGGPPQ